jgi:hypothetical protein
MAAILVSEGKVVQKIQHYKKVARSQKLSAGRPDPLHKLEWRREVQLSGYFTGRRALFRHKRTHCQRTHCGTTYE